MTKNESMGPIDIALLEFPDSAPTGEVATELFAAAESGVIALYDIIAVRKLADGSVEGFEVSELDDGVVSMSVFASARSGLLDDDDITEAGSVLEPGSMAVVLVYENTWAAPVTAAAHRAGGELTASVRISALDVERQLDALEGVG